MSIGSSNFWEVYPGSFKTHMKVMEEVSGNKYPDHIMVFEDGTTESAYIVDIIEGKDTEKGYIDSKESEEDLKQIDNSIINGEEGSRAGGGVKQFLKSSNYDPDSSVFMFDPKTEKILDPDDEAILNEEKPMSFKEPKFKDIFDKFSINLKTDDEEFENSFEKSKITTKKEQFNSTFWRDDLIF